MKNTLKLFAAAAIEMVRNHKQEVAVIGASAAFGGAVFWSHPDYVIERIIDSGLAATTTVALIRTIQIYNRLKREQNNNG